MREAPMCFHPRMNLQHNSPNRLGIKFKFGNLKELSKNNLPLIYSRQKFLLASLPAQKGGTMHLHFTLLGKKNTTTYPEPDALPIAVECVSSKPNTLD